MAGFAWLAALTLRGTVVLSVALGLGLRLRRSSAAARHRLLTLTALGRALRREWRLVAAARPVEGAWLDTLQTASRSLDLARPVRLLSSEEVETPLTGGWPRSAVLVPASSNGGSS